ARPHGPPDPVAGNPGGPAGARAAERRDRAYAATSVVVALAAGLTAAMGAWRFHQLLL
ncbi:MAG: hypothetical protein HXY23_07920, partial [Parvularculaceae bacterium]|nr:hypothetical protein [Parvularculaceae bacterium]